MQSVFKSLQTQWTNLPGVERLQVCAVAVIAGWFIQFVIGGVAFYFARQWQYLSFLHDVLAGSPVTPMGALTGWLFVVMGWLFTVWGAFRCTKLAGKKVFGSILVFWFGVYAFSLPFLLASGVSIAVLWDFFSSGALSLLGFWLAMHHSIRKMGRVVKNEALFSM